MTEAIKKLFSEEVQGKCTDGSFEFGNTHRKTINCLFCIDKNCHYIGQCERRDVPDQELGWRWS